jgi:hypothetical protein
MAPPLRWAGEYGESMLGSTVPDIAGIAADAPVFQLVGNSVEETVDRPLAITAAVVSGKEHESITLWASLV